MNISDDEKELSMIVESTVAKSTKNNKENPKKNQYYLEYDDNSKQFNFKNIDIGNNREQEQGHEERLSKKMCVRCNFHPK